MTIVVYNISRYGDIGEPGYSVSGEELPSGKKKHRHNWWGGSTRGRLNEVMPNAYITQSVYDFLTTDELESIRPMVTGIVEDEYTKDFIRDLGPYYGTFREYMLDDSKIISTGLPGGNDNGEGDDEVDTGESDDEVDTGESDESGNDEGDESGNNGEEESLPPEKNIIDTISDMLGLSKKQIMYAAIIAIIIIIIGSRSS